MSSDLTKATTRQTWSFRILQHSVRALFVVGGTSATKPILAFCGSRQGLISPEWTIGEIEVGRAEGQEGVRVQSENVLVNSSVMCDMLREV